MDWQFKTCIALAIFFGILPFAVKDMPQAVTWAGLGAAVLFGLWGIPWAAQRIPTYHGLLLILSLCGVIVATSLIILSLKEALSLQIGVVVNNAEYPSGLIVSGIEFKTNFTEATIRITNSSQENYEDISLLFQFDEAIAAIAQGSNVPNISFYEKNGLDTRFMLANPAGKTVVVPEIELLATNAGYIMRCPHLPSETTIRVVVALTDISGPPHADYSKLPFEEQVKMKEIVSTVTADGFTYWMGHRDGNVYGPRRSPLWLKIEGKYTVSQMTYPVSKKIDFSPMTFTGPWKFLDGVMSIQK